MQLQHRLVLMASLWLAVIAPVAAAESNAGCAATTGGMREIIECARAAFGLACDDGQSNPEDLVPPIDGPITLRFGEATPYGGKSHGLVYQGRDGLPILAPISGMVTFAGEYRSYGPLLIIDACHQIAQIAGAASFRSSPGTSVKAGNAIGSIHTAGGSSAELYFELRDEKGAIEPRGLAR